MFNETYCKLSRYRRCSLTVAAMYNYWDGGGRDFSSTFLSIDYTRAYIFIRSFDFIHIDKTTHECTNTHTHTHTSYPLHTYCLKDKMKIYPMYKSKLKL